MAELKRDLDEYLLLQSDQKKSFKIDVKLPTLPKQGLIGKIFGRNEEPEANSWLKDTQEGCCPTLVRNCIDNNRAINGEFIFQSRIQRIIGFITCMGLGIFCVTLSTFYIPVLILKARKFTLLYTLGSVFFIMRYYYHNCFGGHIINLTHISALVSSVDLERCSNKCSPKSDCAYL
jgi:hypothetical protein